MNKFVKLWSIKRLTNKHIIGSTILISLVVAPVVCALILSNSMIKAMSDKYIYLSSGHLTVYTSDNIDTSEYKEIKYSNSVCSGYAMMYSQDQNTTIYIKGVEDDYFNEERLNHISFTCTDSIDNHNLSGIAISEYTAKQLNINLGDKIAMMIVPDVAGKSMRPVLVVVNRIYTTGYEAIDSNLAFISYDYAKTLFNGSKAFSHELILNSEKDIDTLTRKIVSYYQVSSWMSSNYSVFSNFVTSKQVIFIILIIVLTMAGFYTSSAARLANEDCMNDISIIKMLGANNRLIFNSSFITMISSTILGIIFGLIFGLLISFNFSPVLKLLSNYGFDALKLYLIDFEIVIDWLSIIICLLILLFISTISVSLVLLRTKRITPIQLFTDN